MPQQAVAKGIGHSELRRLQFTTFFNCVVRKLSGSSWVSIMAATPSRRAFASGGHCEIIGQSLGKCHSWRGESASSKCGIHHRDTETRSNFKSEFQIWPDPKPRTISFDAGTDPR